MIVLIKYERVFGLGNFENEKIGIEMEIKDDEGCNFQELTEETFKAAKNFVLTHSKNYRDKVAEFNDMMLNLNITVGQRSATIRNAKIFMTPEDFKEFEVTFLTNQS